jgi:hypothetical protein
MKKITIEDSRKIALKERINDLEEMDEDEIKTLNISINALHSDLRKGDSRIYNSLCSKCNHANLAVLHTVICMSTFCVRNLSDYHFDYKNNK